VGSAERHAAPTPPGARGQDEQEYPTAQVQHSNGGGLRRYWVTADRGNLDVDGKDRRKGPGLAVGPMERATGESAETLFARRRAPGETKEER